MHPTARTHTHLCSCASAVCALRPRATSHCSRSSSASTNCSQMVWCVSLTLVGGCMTMRKRLATRCSRPSRASSARPSAPATTAACGTSHTCLVGPWCATHHAQHCHEWAGEHFLLRCVGNRVPALPRTPLDHNASSGAKRSKTLTPHGVYLHRTTST